MKIGIKPQHFLLNVNINNGTDDPSKMNQTFEYLHSLNITNYNLWITPNFTSIKKMEVEQKVMKSHNVSRDDYIMIADVDELQDWNARGVHNIYEFIKTEMIDDHKEYVTGYLVDRFAENAHLIDPKPAYDRNASTDVISQLRQQYPHQCDFTEKILDGIIDKVCLYKNVWTLSSGGRHSVKRRRKRLKYKHSIVRNTKKHTRPNRIRGDSDVRYKKFRIHVQHYKWKENVIGYLQKRAKFYKEQGISWWTQSQNAVDWLLENSGNANLDNTSQWKFSCNRDDHTDNFRGNDVHILLCSDEYDRFPMYTLINSIILNEEHIQRLHFHILVLENKQIFTRELELYFGEYSDDITFDIASINEEHPECIEFAEQASSYIDSEKFEYHRLDDPMNFARFCLPDIFADVGVGVYLDVDMIVKNSISKLYDEYYLKHNNVAWSVLNKDPQRIVHRTFSDKKKMDYMNDYLVTNLSAKYKSISSKPIKFEKVGKMFNAGILFFDLDVWRKNGFTAQSLELFKFDRIFEREWSERPWTGITQPIYNMLYVVNNMKVGDFGNEWNVVVKDVWGKGCSKKWSDEHLNDTKFIDANILHFAGDCKPWISPQYAPFASTWIQYIPNAANVTEWENVYNVSFAI